MQIDRGRCAGLRIYKFLNFYNRILHSHLVWQNPNPSPFFFRFFSNVSPKLLCCRFFQSACLSTGATLLKLFFSSFFRFFFFFRFSSLLAFSAFLGFSRPFSAFLGLLSFLGKVGTFQSELLPIFHPRHGNVFGGRKKNVIFVTRGVAYTNTSLQHFQANIFTMPSSDFTPTFSSQHFHNAFFSVTTKTNCSSFALPSSLVSCPHNLHNPPHKRS